MTDDVKKIVRFIQENCQKVGGKWTKSFQQNRLTMNMLVDIFLGKLSPIGTKSIKFHIVYISTLKSPQAQKVPESSQACMESEQRTPNTMRKGFLRN